MSRTTRMMSPHPELEKNWRHALRVWWSLIWRLVLAQLFVMALVIYSTEVPLANYPILRETINSLSVLAAFPLGIWALYAVINKNFGAFRLSLVPLIPHEIAQEDEETEGDGAAQQENEDKKHAKSS